MAKNWIKKNKVYFDFASTIILTIATTYALWKGVVDQNETLKLAEINYQPDFRINYGYADTLTCNEVHKEVFMVELFNDGYKVDVNYTWICAFIDIYKRDSTIIIPINQSGGLCHIEYKSKTGKMESYTIDNIFSKFDEIKEKAVMKIRNIIPERKLIGFRLKYILKLAFFDYSKTYKEVFFEITDWSNPEILSNDEGEKYFNLTKRGVPYFIQDITEDFLLKKILE